MKPGTVGYITETDYIDQVVVVEPNEIEDTWVGECVVVMPVDGGMTVAVHRENFYENKKDALIARKRRYSSEIHVEEMKIIGHRKEIQFSKNYIKQLNGKKDDLDEMIKIMEG